MQRDDLYTVRDLSDVFGVTRQTIHRWLDDGRFPNAFTMDDTATATVYVPKGDVTKVRREEAEKHLEALRKLGFQPNPA